MCNNAVCGYKFKWHVFEPIKNGRLGNVRSGKAQKPVMQVVMSHSPVLRRAHDYKSPYTQTVLLFIYSVSDEISNEVGVEVAEITKLCCHKKVTMQHKQINLLL